MIWIFYSFIWKNNLNLFAFLNKLYEENILENPYWDQQSIIRIIEFLLYLKNVLKGQNQKTSILIQISIISKFLKCLTLIYIEKNNVYKIRYLIQNLNIFLVFYFSQ